jgi:hypothetical protein
MQSYVRIQKSDKKWGSKMDRLLIGRKRKIGSGTHKPKGPSETGNARLGVGRKVDRNGDRRPLQEIRH